MTADLPPSVEGQSAPRAFSGVDRLHGRGAYSTLQNASVLVVGLGGVGSWATEALVRNGVGRIAIADLDQVAESNINRQIQALVPTLGMAKTDAMAQRIAMINPMCSVFPQRKTSANLAGASAARRRREPF